MKEVQIGCMLFGVGTKYIYICFNPGRSGETSYFHPSFSKWTKIEEIEISPLKYTTFQEYKLWVSYFEISRFRRAIYFVISPRWTHVTLPYIKTIAKRFSIDIDITLFRESQKLERKRKKGGTS